MVDKVYDGDTLRLNDGRKLRLIGVNTPEHGRKHQVAEPYANEAEAFLRAQIKSGRIKLRYGQEKQDRYGRVLAHIFTPEGYNITQALLEAGLGSAIQISPNLWAHKCYQQAEKKAQAAKRGLWGHPYFLPTKVTQLSSTKLGYRFVRGQLTRVGRSKKALWLNLGHKFAIRISTKDLKYFNVEQIEARVGTDLIVRGWVYKSKSQYRMNISHATAITWQPELESLKE
ncbi:MAG: thermonuclease family protein [Gammaproteobacteria bacterium]|nr:thermonuclease family protein [Gammaproteobacteria bacterium]